MATAPFRWDKLMPDTPAASPVPMHWMRIGAFQRFVDDADYVIQHRDALGTVSHTLWRGRQLNLTHAWEWGLGFYAARVTDAARDS